MVVVVSPSSGRLLLLLLLLHRKSLRKLMGKSEVSRCCGMAMASGGLPDALSQSLVKLMSSRRG